MTAANSSDTGAPGGSGGRNAAGSPPGSHSGVQPVMADVNRLGKYRLVAALGQGGMGTVYLALAGGLGEFQKLLVIKELRADLARRPTFVGMFMDEATLAARLSHPNVVQTVEAGQSSGPDGERYFLAMEYLDGQPLNLLLDRLRHGDQLPLSHHLWILAEALAGLHYAHELRDYDGESLHVVHRDVSPQNVFVTYHGEVKVVDFGVAKAANATAVTNPGVFKGKFAYASPEQTQGRPVDRRSDIFSLGVMLWEALAGRRFAQGAPTPASFAARSAGSEPRIGLVAPDVDPELARICDRAMALDPQERFATAAEMRGALLAYLSKRGTPVDAEAVGALTSRVFEQERRDVQRVLDGALGSGARAAMVATGGPVDGAGPAGAGADTGASASVVTSPVPVLDGARDGAQDDDPTTVVDLSDLIENTRMGTDLEQAVDGRRTAANAPEPFGPAAAELDISPAVAALRARRLGPVGTLALAGVVLAVTALLVVSALRGASDDGTPPEAPATTADTAPEAAHGASAKVSPETTATQPTAPAARTAAQTLTPVPGGTKPAAALATRAQQAPPPRVRRPRDVAQAPKRTAPAATSAPPATKTTHATAATTRIAASARPSMRAQARAPAAPQMGDELKRPEPAERRFNIDMEDPYSD